MSEETLDFYVQGRIEPETPFHIVAKTQNNNLSTIIDSSVASVSGLTNWSVCGVKENYVNFYDIASDPFFIYDSSSQNYYYPVYLTQGGNGSTGVTIVTGGVLTGITITTPGQLYKQGQTVNIGIGGATGVVDVNQTGGITNVTIVTPGSGYINGTTGVAINSSVSLVQTNVSINSTTGGFPGTGITLYGGSSSMTAQTTPPQNDLKYKSWNAIKNMEYVVFDGTNYRYPLSLYGTSTSSYTINPNPTAFTFYGSASVLSSTISPNINNGDLLFYNPYDSLLESVFKYTQTQDGAINFQLVSAGHYMESAHSYQYMSYDSNYNVNMTKDPTQLKNFVLKPVSKNVNSSKIYAGVPYTLQVSENTNSLNFEFVNNIVRDSVDIISPYFNESQFPVSSSTSNSFIGKSNNYPLSTSNIEQTFGGTDIVFYFIPTAEMTYQLSTQDILLYLEYRAVDMLTLSPQVYNLPPKVKYPSDSTGQYIWRTTTGQSTGSNELVFGTQVSGAYTGLAYNYCSGSNTCGKCFGKCDLSTVVNPTTQCIYDTLSVENFNSGQDDVFTCDHERYLEKSEHVSKSMIKTHSHTALILILVIGLILAAGIILFEERNKISKEFYKLKNGRK